MKDLIEALQILLKYADKDPYAPTHCEHDILYLYPGFDSGIVSLEDLERLDALGFTPNSEFGGWQSFRYGSC